MTDIPILPGNDRVLIKVSEVQKVSSAGVILATGDYFNRQEQQKDRGEIVAIAKNAFKYIYDGSCDYKIGDKILFETYGGKEEVVETEKSTVRYRLIRDVDIVGKLLMTESKQSETISSEFVRETTKQLDDMYHYNK